MGHLKKFLARLFKGKSKVKKLAKSYADTVIVAITSTESKTVSSAPDPNSPSATSLEPEDEPTSYEKLTPDENVTPEVSSVTVEEISTPFESDRDPTAWQAVLWRPPVLPVPPVIPWIATSRVQAMYPAFVGAATALSLGSPPSVVIQNFPLNRYFAPRSYQFNPVEMDIMHRLQEASALIRSAMAMVEDSSENFSPRMASCRWSDASVMSIPFPEAECPGPVPIRAVRPRGNEVHHTLAGPSNGTPGAQGTPLVLGGPIISRQPYYVAPGATRFGGFGRAHANAKAPLYPPGLGFPTDKEVANAAAKCEPVLVPTFSNARPASCQSKNSTVPTIPNVRPAHLQGRPVKQGVPFPRLSSTESSCSDFGETIRIQPDPQHIYNASRTLGKGGNGTVWYAKLDQGDGLEPVDVAMKVYNTKQFLARNFRASTLRAVAMNEANPDMLIGEVDNVKYNWEEEINIMERLQSEGSCPFVVPLLQSFKSDDNLYLVMRYYPENLRSRAQNTSYRLNRPQIRLIAAELALALEFLHSRFVVHHDLKLDNVLVTPDGHIALCDFGNAYMYREEEDGDDFEGKWIKGGGTLGYYAPEQFDRKLHNYKADMYAFGLMLLDLFCSGDPWYTKIPGTGDEEDFRPNNPSPLHPMVQGRVFDDDAWNLIAKLLDTNPEARPEWTEVKEHRYFRDVDWERVTAREYDPHYRPCDRDQKDLRAFIPTDRWAIKDKMGYRLLGNELYALERILDLADEQGAGICSANLDWITDMPWNDEAHGVACMSRPGPCTCHSL
ncbi:hypothetical protein HYDPIDRAFT_167644 [Hydnomerulius pinastri MD-312]|uniref:Non-specific serine/threonine protein kinase n=1 Tax=Hydnomerulius pinastri MD-312 TaxID=994086 RepID=A0A0C9W1Q6_9AGAM|nr:hypothetical protein HYDPIDRAFT_167644 [Hydnomerulius pinastri MD-312]